MSRHHAVNAAVAVGLDVEKYICGDPATGQACAYHGECKFQAQKPATVRAEVVIAAHQSLFGTLSKIITENVGLVVVDKSWWKAGLNMARETRIAGFADAITSFPPLRDANATFGKFNRPKYAPKIMVPDDKATQKLIEWSLKAEAAFLDTPVDCLVSKAIVLATGLTGENCREAIKLEWRRQVEPAIWPGMPRKMRKDAIEAAIVNANLPKRAGIWRALAELLDGAETHTGRLQADERPDVRGADPVILLHSRRDISTQLEDLPILLLDASFPEQIIKYFLPRINATTRIDATAPFMTVTQIIRGWGRSYMVPAHTSKVAPEENRRRENFLAELRDFVALNKTDRGALVVTYKDIEHHFAKIPGVATGHFNALRGIDAHRNVGAVFIIGRPLPDFNELRTMAMALTGLPVPIETPHKEFRGLVMANGSNRSIEVRAYADPTLEMLRSAITDAEVIDNVGRARAVNRTSPDDGVHVYLMTDVVTPLPVTTLNNWSNLRLSPVARMAASGCVLHCSVDAQKVYPDLFPTPNAAKLAIRREKARWVSNPYERVPHKGTTPTSPAGPRPLPARRRREKALNGLVRSRDDRRQPLLAGTEARIANPMAAPGSTTARRTRRRHEPSERGDRPTNTRSRIALSTSRGQRAEGQGHSHRYPHRPHTQRLNPSQALRRHYRHTRTSQHSDGLLNRRSNPMGEAKKRRPKANQPLNQAISQFADSVLYGSGDAPTVTIGPLVWGIEPGHDTKHWYFIVGSADAAGNFRSDQLSIPQDDKPLAKEARAALMQAFIERRPVVVHDFDDELEMIRFCEALWACDKTHRLLAAVEQERGIEK